MKNSDLIYGLMASFNKVEYSIQDLKYLLSPFDITETSLRTNLSRMTSNNILKTRRDGKKAYYSFCGKGSRIKSNVALSFKPLNWRDWDDRWWGVLFSVPNMKNPDRHSIRKKLIAYRFANLYPGFWVRPLNENESIPDYFENAILNKYCTLIKFEYFNDLSKNDISKLWTLDAINRQLKEGLKILENAMTKTKNLTAEQALVEKMINGNIIVPILFKDPLLPEKFLPHDWMGNMLRVKFFEYDNNVTTISKPYWHKIF